MQTPAASSYSVLKQAAARKLQPQFETRGNVHKTYLAKVFGHPRRRMPSTVKLALAPNRSKRVLASSMTQRGQEARTEFKTLDRFDDGSARCFRYTLSPAAPIKFDSTYGISDCRSSVTRRTCRNASLENSRHSLPTRSPLCLHAWQIEFDHPITDEMIGPEGAKAGLGNLLWNREWEMRASAVMNDR